jgi:pimeloyl-ACP methyl ester carboxylesterase
MKALQWLAAAVLVMAGLVLVRPVLSQPAKADGSPAAGPTRFAVTDAGTVGKPDVVLIPGLASSKSVWDAEAKLLAPNYRLHLVQVAGFAGAPAGPNAAPATAGGMLAGIVEQLHEYISGAGMRPVVVGHSLGGLLGMMLAERYPADVRKLVIVDTLPYYAVLFSPGATVETVRPMAAAMRAHFATMGAEEFAAGEKTMLEGMAISQAGQKAAYDSAIASDYNVVGEALYEDLTTDLRGEVAKIATPTLVLYEYDAASKMPPADAYEAMMQSAYKPMPNVTLVRVDGARHFIMYDQPAKFDADLEPFLK